MVVEKAGLVEQDPVLVVVEPEGLRVSAHDAHLAPVGGIRDAAQELEYDDPVLSSRKARDRVIGDGAHLGLALVVGHRQAGVGLHARQPLLRLVDDPPGFLDGHVERPVGDDVAPAEEVVVLDADPFQGALQDPERVGVAVDASDDRRLVLDADPPSGDHSFDRFPGGGVPLVETVTVLGVAAVGSLGEQFVGMVEVGHQPEPDVWVGLVEPVHHVQEGVVEAVGVEGQFLGAEPDRLNAGFGEGGEPGGELAVGQHHGVSAGEEYLAEFLAAGFGVATAVGGHRGVVRADVVGDLEDLGKALLLDGAVAALDRFAGDQLLPVAEPAVRRAGRDHIEEAHLVFVEQAFDGAVVHLVAGVLGTLEVESLVGGCFDELLQGGAVLGYLEVVAGYLHRHAGFDVALCSSDPDKLIEFGGGVESDHVLGGGAVDEGVEAVEDLPVVSGVLYGVEDEPLPIGRFVFCLAHGWFLPPLAPLCSSTVHQ